MLKDHTYRTKDSKYPSPQHYYGAEDNLFIYTCSWGSLDGGNKTIDIIKDYYLSAKTDSEATSPFPLRADQSLSSNHLRISCQLANDILFKENNSNEYTTAVEVLAVAINGRELNIAYVGGPSVYIIRRNKAIPILQQSHMGHEFDHCEKYPLARDFMGLVSGKQIHYCSYHINKGDRLLIIQRDYLNSIGTKSFKEITSDLSKENSKLPFVAFELTI